LIINYLNMKKLLFSLSLIAAFALTNAQGYEITVKMKNYASDTLIIGHHFAESQLIPDDTVVTDKAGIGVFKSKTALPGGMYFLFFSSKQKVDFLLDKNQKFTIEGDAKDIYKTIKFKGDLEYAAFAEYQILRGDVWQKSTDFNKERKIADSLGNVTRVKEIDAELKKLNEASKAGYDKLLADFPNSFMATFLRAAQDVQVPAEITDRTKQYEYYRYHFFDTFNISDARLLRTPIYQNKIDTYIDKLIPQHPDSLIVQVDFLISKSRTTKEMLRFMLVHLFNKYAGSQVVTAENVYVHIAQKYYLPEADWSDPEFIKDLKEKVDKKSKCLVGGRAMDIKYQTVTVDSLKIDALLKSLKLMKEKGIEIEKSGADDATKNNAKVQELSKYYNQFHGEQKLSQSKAEYTILWFWTPDCSHCKKETPLFYDLYVQKELNKKNVQVVSIFLNKTDLNGEWDKFCKTTEEWLQFVENHDMKLWKNVWSPFDPFRFNYDINSSPVLYILDKDFKIVTKRIGYEQAIELIVKELEAK